MKPAPPETKIFFLFVQKLILKKFITFELHIPDLNFQIQYESAKRLPDYKVYQCILKFDYFYMDFVYELVLDNKSLRNLKIRKILFKLISFTI